MSFDAFLRTRRQFSWYVVQIPWYECPACLSIRGARASVLKLSISLHHREVTCTLFANTTFFLDYVPVQTSLVKVEDSTNCWRCK